MTGRIANGRKESSEANRYTYAHFGGRGVSLSGKSGDAFVGLTSGKNKDKQLLLFSPDDGKAPFFETHDTAIPSLALAASTGSPRYWHSKNIGGSEYVVVVQTPLTAEMLREDYVYHRDRVFVNGAFFIETPLSHYCLAASVFIHPIFGACVFALCCSSRYDTYSNQVRHQPSQPYHILVYQLSNKEVVNDITMSFSDFGLDRKGVADRSQSVSRVSIDRTGAYAYTSVMESTSADGSYTRVFVAIKYDSTVIEIERVALSTLMLGTYNFATTFASSSTSSGNSREHTARQVYAASSPAKSYTVYRVFDDDGGHYDVTGKVEAHYNTSSSSNASAETSNSNNSSTVWVSPTVEAHTADITGKTTKKTNGTTTYDHKQLNETTLWGTVKIGRDYRLAGGFSATGKYNADYRTTGTVQYVYDIWMNFQTLSGRHHTLATETGTNEKSQEAITGTTVDRSLLYVDFDAKVAIIEVSTYTESNVKTQFRSYIDKATTSDFYYLYGELWQTGSTYSNSSGTNAHSHKIITTSETHVEVCIDAEVFTFPKALYENTRVIYDIPASGSFEEPVVSATGSNTSVSEPWQGPSTATTFLHATTGTAWAHSARLEDKVVVAAHPTYLNRPLVGIDSNLVPTDLTAKWFLKLYPSGVYGSNELNYPLSEFTQVDSVYPVVE